MPASAKILIVDSYRLLTYTWLALYTPNNTAWQALHGAWTTRTENTGLNQYTFLPGMAMVPW